MKHKEKRCNMCSELFYPSCGFQIYCGSRTMKVGCSYRNQKLKQNKRRIANPDYFKKKKTEFMQRNENYLRNYSKEYYKNHKDYVKRRYEDSKKNKIIQL